MKVLVKTALSSYSGYGNDGIGIVRALLNLGADVYLDPSHVSAPLPPSVAQILTKRLVAPFDLLIHHADPTQLSITPEARKSAKVTVGWTMWEYTTLDNCHGRSKFRKNYRDYDVIFGYDAVSTAALAPYSDRVSTLQGGFWPDAWSPAERDWTGDRFGFCMVGALHQRKDPFVAIQAFQELKEEYPEEFEGAELHLKTNVPGLHSAMQEWVPKLRVHYSVWPEEVLHAFYLSQHCLLAPSRGEGKNVPALEFLSTGGTVIATNFGGHQQWLSSEYAYPLDHILVAESPQTPNCKSARASKQHLKELMLHVYRNRAEARRKGAIAADIIPSICGWAAVMDRLFLKIAEQVPGAGEQLLHRARVLRETSNQHLPGLVGARV